MRYVTLVAFTLRLKSPPTKKNDTKDGKVGRETARVSPKAERSPGLLLLLLLLSLYHSVMKMWTLPSVADCSLSSPSLALWFLSFFPFDLPPLRDVWERGCCGSEPQQQSQPGHFSQHGLLPQTPGARAGEGAPRVRRGRTSASVRRVTGGRKALERIQPLWVSLKPDLSFWSWRKCLQATALLVI